MRLALFLDALGWTLQALTLIVLGVLCFADLWADLAPTSTHCHDPFNPPKGVGDAGEVGPSFDGEAP